MEPKIRCKWCKDDTLYQEYHDQEWGVPLYDDRKLFEFLVLETFQAGLSWITILRKRKNFRVAFDDFDYTKIANYTENKIQELLLDTGIVRNKLKIRAAVSNANAFIRIQQEYGSFSKYLWNFVANQPIINHWKDTSEVPATTVLSDTISKELKKKGFKFVGSTIIYAKMQAIGMVNDHTVDCWTRVNLKDISTVTTYTF